MKWYLAKIIFNININEGYNQSQFDEQWRIIEATDQNMALEKAINIGKCEEQIFANQNNENIHWKFIDVMELSELPELIDGAEIYSNTIEIEKRNEYIKLIKLKAKRLQNIESIYV